MTRPATYPPIEPFITGLLPVGDGQEIYWEASGAGDGKPVLYLHGGPGGGMKTGYRSYADPETHLIVGMEQRGCGRSRPLVTDDINTLATNTTGALIADIEALREHLDVEQWLLIGISWGCTLSLAYAQAYPDRVSEIVLMAVTTTTAAEVEWLTESIGRMFPKEWAAFREAAAPRTDERIIDAYDRLLTDSDVDVRVQAARAWMAWEDTHISLAPGYSPRDGNDEAREREFATLVVHYWKHAGFLDDDQILRNVPRIAHIPAVLIHGRYDISGPADIPWHLHQSWPGSRLIIVETEGHGGPEMASNVTRAVDSFSGTTRAG